MPENINLPCKTNRFLPRAVAVFVLLFSLFSIQGARSELAKLEHQSRGALGLLFEKGQHNWGMYQGPIQSGAGAGAVDICIGYLETELLINNTATFDLQGKLRAKFIANPELVDLTLKIDFANYLQFERINGQAKTQSAVLEVKSGENDPDKIDFKLISPEHTSLLELPVPKPVFLWEVSSGEYALRLPEELDNLAKGQAMGAAGIKLKRLTEVEFESCKRAIDEGLAGNIPDFSELGKFYQAWMAQKEMAQRKLESL